MCHNNPKKFSPPNPSDRIITVKRHFVHPHYTVVLVCDCHNTGTARATLSVPVQCSLVPVAASVLQLRPTLSACHVLVHATIDRLQLGTSAALWTAQSGAHHPQARVCACATTRAGICRAQVSSGEFKKKATEIFTHLPCPSQETDSSAAPAEALQNRVHQGADTARAHCPSHSPDSAERGEDAGLRSGQEARGAARDCHSHTGTDAAQQT